MYPSKRVPLKGLNPHIMCVLCGGYLIQATTIIECLHSFCKSCILNFLETSDVCPICDVQVHKTWPLLNMKLDHTLQSLVYKLVPGLFQDEMKKRREYHWTVSDSYVKTLNLEERGDAVMEKELTLGSDHISVVLQMVAREDESGTLQVVDQRNLLCPSEMTVAHLKKFVQLKFGLNSQNKIVMYKSKEELTDDLMLQDVAFIYAWKRLAPLTLFYSVARCPKDTKVWPKTQSTALSSVSVSSAIGSFLAREDSPDKATNLAVEPLLKVPVSIQTTALMAPCLMLPEKIKTEPERTSNPMPKLSLCHTVMATSKIGLISPLSSSSLSSSSSSFSTLTTAPHSTFLPSSPRMSSATTVISPKCSVKALPSSLQSLSATSSSSSPNTTLSSSLSSSASLISPSNKRIASITPPQPSSHSSSPSSSSSVLSSPSPVMLQRNIVVHTLTPTTKTSGTVSNKTSVSKTTHTLANSNKNRNEKNNSAPVYKRKMETSKGTMVKSELSKSTGVKSELSKSIGVKSELSKSMGVKSETSKITGVKSESAKKSFVSSAAVCCNTNTLAINRTAHIAKTVSSTASASCQLLSSPSSALSSYTRPSSSSSLARSISSATKTTMATSNTPIVTKISLNSVDKSSGVQNTLTTTQSKVTQKLVNSPQVTLSLRTDKTLKNYNTKPTVQELQVRTPIVPAKLVTQQEVTTRLSLPKTSVSQSPKSSSLSLSSPPSSLSSSSLDNKSISTVTIGQIHFVEERNRKRNHSDTADPSPLNKSHNRQVLPSNADNKELSCTTPRTDVKTPTASVSPARHVKLISSVPSSPYGGKSSMNSKKIIHSVESILSPTPKQESPRVTTVTAKSKATAENVAATHKDSGKKLSKSETTSKEISKGEKTSTYVFPSSSPKEISGKHASKKYKYSSVFEESVRKQKSCSSNSQIGFSCNTPNSQLPRKSSYGNSAKKAEDVNVNTRSDGLTNYSHCNNNNNHDKNKSNTTYENKFNFHNVPSYNYKNHQIPSPKEIQLTNKDKHKEESWATSTHIATPPTPPPSRNPTHPILHKSISYDESLQVTQRWFGISSPEKRNWKKRKLSEIDQELSNSQSSPHHQKPSHHQSSELPSKRFCVTPDSSPVGEYHQRGDKHRNELPKMKDSRNGMVQQPVPSSTSSLTPSSSPSLSSSSTSSSSLSNTSAFQSSSPNKEIDYQNYLHHHHRHHHRHYLQQQQKQEQQQRTVSQSTQQQQQQHHSGPISSLTPPYKPATSPLVQPSHNHQHHTLTNNTQQRVNHFPPHRTPTATPTYANLHPTPLPTSSPNLHSSTSGDRKYVTTPNCGHDRNNNRQDNAHGNNKHDKKMARKNIDNINNKSDNTNAFPSVFTDTQPNSSMNQLKSTKTKSDKHSQQKQHFYPVTSKKMQVEDITVDVNDNGSNVHSESSSSSSSSLSQGSPSSTLTSPRSSLTSPGTQATSPGTEDRPDSAVLPECRASCEGTTTYAIASILSAPKPSTGTNTGTNVGPSTSTTTGTTPLDLTNRQKKV